MGDRATLEKIFAIMRRLLLVPLNGANPIPRKGTTRHECYRALYEIQELLETRRVFGNHLPQTNADRIRSMTDEELADWLLSQGCKAHITDEWCKKQRNCRACWLDWLREEVEE